MKQNSEFVANEWRAGSACAQRNVLGREEKRRKNNPYLCLIKIVKDIFHHIFLREEKHSLD